MPNPHTNPINTKAKPDFSKQITNKISDKK
jgi:hypothetical protein